jgi:hypothetical protein
MKNKKQYIASLERIIDSDDNLANQYGNNIGTDVEFPFDDDDAVIKCAEKTLKTYQKNAIKLLSKIEKVFAA